jgi:AhpD family alkylhydroperoxidase
MIRLMANSPAILDAYLRFNEAFESTKLPPTLRGLITTAVSELNGCDYTLSVAFALGKREGLSDDELVSARIGEAADPRTRVALRFAMDVVRERGHIPSEEVERLREAGFDEQEIVEIVALIALNIFRNYFNLVAGTEVDFPLVSTNAIGRGTLVSSHVN